MRRRALLLSAALSWVACRREVDTSEPAPADPPPASTAYPGTLVPIGAVAHDFLMRQKLHGRWREQRFSFEAVIQKQGDVLTVIGLTPFGTKAFVLTQTGTEVAFQKLVDRDMPFPPEYILQDIHRAFLYAAVLPWEESGAPGSNEIELHGERVRDTFVDGGLRSRTFVRLDGQPPGELAIDYAAPGMRDGTPPPTVQLRNGWFGYTLDIAVVDYQLL